MGSKLAVQMYTLRDYTKTAKNFAETLKKCADMGYPAVQLSAVGCMSGDNPEVSPEEARKMLDDNGLRCIATHRAWDSFMNNVEDEIKFHKILGCDYAAIGGIPGNIYDNTVEGYRKWLADFRTFSGKLKDAGIRFGHHNHAHEFFRPELDGPRLEDILVDEGGEDLMMELDLFWVWHGGECPVKMVERCKGRIPVIHLKDKGFYHDENNPNGIAPIGEGNMPWEKIIPACEANDVDWYCIEHDVCPRDPFDCLKSSFDYLDAMGL